MIGLVSGVRFVLDKLVTAVDGELNDEERLREELLAAQMRLEVGEITADQLAAIETDLLPRLRAIREARQGLSTTEANVRVTGVEASFIADEEHE